MIIQLARTFKASAFNAMLAYVLVLSVLFAGFAQASATDRMLNGGIEICVTDPVTGQTGTGQQPAGTSGHDCQMCCLAAHQSVSLLPITITIIARFGIELEHPFPVKVTGHTYGLLGSAQARAPPIG